MLAFTIDAWWEERGLRIEEQQVLQGLHEEFLSVRKVLSQHLSEHLEGVQAMEAFLIAVESRNTKEGGPIVDAVLLELMSPMTSDLGSGTLAALLSSGRIEILTNRTLRAKLASWEGVIGEVWDDQAFNAKSVFEFHVPYFLAENIPAGAAMHQWYDEWSLPRRSLSDRCWSFVAISSIETCPYFIADFRLEAEAQLQASPIAGNGHSPSVNFSLVNSGL